MGHGASSADISVVIPYFNDARTIHRALESVRLALPRAERIVVDDGSDVALGELDDVVVLRQANSGPGAARNLGASHATRDWMIFLDADDVLCTSISRALPLLGPGVGLVSGPVLVQSGSTEKLTAPIALNGVGATAGLLAASFIVSKQLFDSCAGYDPLIRFGENTDLVIRCADGARRRSLEVRTSPESFSIYHAPPEAGRRLYDHRRLQSTEHLLRRGRIDLEDPAERSRMHSIAAVAASRTRHYGGAVFHAARAARLQPSRVTAARLLATLTGPIARLWWARADRGSAPSK